MAMALVITDVYTLFISLLGIIISIGYILNEAFRPYHTGSDIQNERNNIVEWLRNDDADGNRLKVILADYESGNEWINRRDNVTLLVGTILITSSFLILGNVAIRPEQPTSIFSFASIGLFAIWLLVLHQTGKRINGMIYRHLKSIEGALTEHFQHQGQALQYSFGTHLLVVEGTTDQSDTWIRIRRMFWAFVLLLLSLSWMLLSISTTLV